MHLPVRKAERWELKMDKGCCGGTINFHRAVRAALFLIDSLLPHFLWAQFVTLQ